MKTLLAGAVGTATLLAADISWAEHADMMNDGMWGAGWMGGFGGVWLPIVLVSVVIGLFAWIVKRQDG